MNRPGILWSFFVAVICVGLSFPALGRGVSASAQKPRDHDYEIAARFAPIFYQALGEDPRGDYITNFDFDGDWRGDNNWENLDQKKFSLRAYIYYAVTETLTHYFIHYAVFHPRDYKGGEHKGIILSDIIHEGVKRGADKDPTGWMLEAGVAHENDLEGVLIVVAKDGNDLDRAHVEYIDAFHHNDFELYASEAEKLGVKGFKTEERRPELYVEPKGHGIEAYTGDDKQVEKKNFMIYRYEGRAEDPETIKEGSIGYELLPIETTLWARAKNVGNGNITYAYTKNFGEVAINVQDKNGKATLRKIKVGPLGFAFVGNSGGRNMARPPWSWFDRNHRSDLPGYWFFDPADLLKRDFKLGEGFSTTYARLPFWAK
jgi:hypothetical protein